MSPADLYHYKAYITRVPTGASCLVDIDLGFGIWMRGQEIELHRFSAADTKDAGDAARDYLRTLVLDREVLLRTIKDRRDTPPRLLGEIVVVTEVGETVDVIDAMVAQGHGVRSDN